MCLCHLNLSDRCLLTDNILDYWYVSQGKLTVPSIDDKEDMMFADEAFDILGFSTQMKYDVFKNTACMMHMGNMTKVSMLTKVVSKSQSTGLCASRAGHAG